MNLPSLDILCKWNLTIFSFRVWLISNHVVACIRTSCLFMVEYCSIVYTYHFLCISSSVDGHLGCFYFCESCCVNIGAQIPVQAPAFHSCGHIASSGIARSYGGAWWAAVYGVAQSRTRLKRLSSSSSRTSQELPNCKTL